MPDISAGKLTQVLLQEQPMILTNEPPLPFLGHMIFREDGKTGKVMETWEGKRASHPGVWLKPHLRVKNSSIAVKTVGRETTFFPYIDILC